MIKNVILVGMLVAVSGAWADGRHEDKHDGRHEDKHHEDRHHDAHAAPSVEDNGLGGYLTINTTNLYAPPGGQADTMYVFRTGAATAAFKRKYGRHWKLRPWDRLTTWGKYHKKGGLFRHKVTQPLLTKPDGAIVELGGVKAGQIVSYSNLGLYWQGAGGISHTPKVNVVGIRTNGKATGAKAYSKVVLLESLSWYVPGYGLDSGTGTVREGYGKVYKDVKHIVMHHGTTDNKRRVRCWDTPLVSQGLVQYEPKVGYNSYAMELWIAKGVGIIKHAMPYIEDGKTAGCQGYMFSDPGEYTRYIYK